MYSPITQNERHLALIKEMRKGTKNFLTRGLFENNFDNNYRSLIVMANTKKYYRLQICSERHKG